MSLFDVCRDGFLRKDVVTQRELSGTQGLRYDGLDGRCNDTTNGNTPQRSPSYHHGEHDAPHY